MNSYQQEALRTKTGLKVSVNDSNEDLIHGAMGLSSEAGEILTIVKAHLFYGKPFDNLNMREELGDCFWYLALLAEWMGMTFEDLQEMNLEKLRIRYPEKFDAQLTFARDYKKESRAFQPKEGIDL